MKQLILNDGIYPQICSLARAYEGEFAVMLFGSVRGDEHVVTHIAPPGKKAVNDWAFCTNDQDHESAFYERLSSEHPGIQWLGDLHAHPPGMAWLSGTDRRTIREILVGTTDAVHPEEYVAGVMLRTEAGLDIFPTHFTRENLRGSPMEVRHEGIHQKPQGTGSLITKTFHHCRSWIGRQHVRRHGGAGGRGHDHADRP